jgi:hypothetical protein
VNKQRNSFPQVTISTSGRYPSKIQWNALCFKAHIFPHNTAKDCFFFAVKFDRYCNDYNTITIYSDDDVYYVRWDGTRLADTCSYQFSAYNTDYKVCVEATDFYISDCSTYLRYYAGILATDLKNVSRYFVYVYWYFKLLYQICVILNTSNHCTELKALSDMSWKSTLWNIIFTNREVGGGIFQCFTDRLIL